MSSTFTERRKADRAKMASIIVPALIEAGATIREAEYPGPREIAFIVEVEHGGRLAVVRLEFDGDSCQPDTYVATWNTRDGACFSDAMGYHTLNHYHFAKASRVCRGFDNLLRTLRDDVACLASGAGFDTEREAMKRAEYAARAEAMAARS